jgi:hypothetical protein
MTGCAGKQLLRVALGSDSSEWRWEPILRSGNEDKIFVEVICS